MLYRYARTIVSEEDSISKVEKLKKMKSKDLLTIMSFQDKFFHGPEMKSTFACPIEDCGEEDVVDIPFRLSFFFPDVSEFSTFDGKGVQSSIPSKHVSNRSEEDGRSNA